MNKYFMIEDSQKNFEQEPADLSRNVERELEHKDILVIQEKSVITYEELEKLRREQGGDKRLYVCDFYIDGIDQPGTAAFDGSSFRKGQIVNIDHHSEEPSMRRFVSSTNLALDYVGRNHDFKQDSSVVIHHTDADSTMTTLIMCGNVTRKQAIAWGFDVAAIAADHTGEPNDIADLLQALRSGAYQSQPTSERLIFSTQNLEKLLRRENIDSRAKVLLEGRLQERASLSEKVRRGDFNAIGENQEVAWLQFNATEDPDAVMLPALFPKSHVIFAVRSDPKMSGRYFMNVRLGKPAEGKFDLRDIMKIANIPFGGRWNAGANKRKGGTELSPEEFAAKIYAALEEKIG